MAWPPVVNDTLRRLDRAKLILKDLFTERDAAIELLFLSAVCQEHVLFLGPPGTAKTEIINRFTQLIDAQSFHYLLTRFTEPSELFGPLDLAAFHSGTYAVRTEKMLPDVQIAILDEVFQGSSAILNTLLSILNERVFHNGSKQQRIPLLSLIGASNLLPDDPWLRAFSDRFLLRLELSRVEDGQIESLLEQGWVLERESIESAKKAAGGLATGKISATVGMAELQALHGRLLEVDMSQVRHEYAQILRELRSEGVELSDRRSVKGQKLVAGAALLRGAEAAAMQDLWPLLHMWNRPEEEKLIRSVLNPRLVSGGAAALALSRQVPEIMTDLKTLEAQQELLMSEAALGAHIRDLNKLRRELVNDHPKEVEGRKLVEKNIKQILARIEAAHV